MDTGMELARKPETFKVIKFEVKPDVTGQIPYGSAPDGIMLISGPNGPQGLVKPGLFANPGDFILLGDRGSAMVATQAELDDMTQADEWHKSKEAHPSSAKPAPAHDPHEKTEPFSGSPTTSEVTTEASSRMTPKKS